MTNEPEELDDFEIREQAFDAGCRCTRQLEGPEAALRIAEDFGTYDFCFWAGYYGEPWSTVAPKEEVA